MSAENFYRAGIYRMRVRMQPPSVYLLVVAVALMLAGIALAFAVAIVRPFPIELDLTRWLQSVIPAAVIQWLLDVEQPLLMASAALGLIALGALFLFRRGDAIFLALALLAGYACLEALKRLFARPRPTPELVRVVQSSGSFAFPSSIVGFALIAALLFCYITVRAYRARGYNETRDTLALGGVLLISLLLIALSSLAVLALGAHWPSDVLGAYLFGGAYAILSVLLRRQWMKWRGTDKVQ